MPCKVAGKRAPRSSEPCPSFSNKEDTMREERNNPAHPSQWSSTKKPWIKRGWRRTIDLTAVIWTIALCYVGSWGAAAGFASIFILVSVAQSMRKRGEFWT